MCISVDLPEPDGPMIALKRPRSKPDAHAGQRVHGGVALSVAAVDVHRGHDRIHAAQSGRPRLASVRITGHSPPMDPKTMWGAGNYAAVAEQDLRGRRARRRARGRRAGHGRARRGLRDRQRDDPGGQGGRARDRPRLRARLLEIARERGRRRDGRGRLRRGRRPGAALRRRELRPRRVDLRAHVRARPRAHRRGDARVCAARAA